jgi:hypothetical protein
MLGGRGTPLVAGWEDAETVNAEALREYCLARSGASETFPFGPETSVF